MSNLATFVDDETGIEARVYAEDRGFTVVVRDLDSGEYLPTILVYKTLQAALTKAENIVNGAGPCWAPVF